jgi:hypothetical protein
MPRLTLRTLLAYIDDTLEPNEARDLGKKVADSAEAKHLVERIKRVTRRRGLAAPDASDEDDAAGDPNTVAEYLDNALDSPTLKQVEETCLESDVHLAEVAACHQILTLVLTEPVRVPPRAHRRMYELVQPPASVPSRRPNRTLPVSASAPPADGAADPDDADAALLFGLKRYSATTWATRLALLGAVAALLVVLAGSVYQSLKSPADALAPEVAKGPSGPMYVDARSVNPDPTPATKKEVGAPPSVPSKKEPEPDPTTVKKDPDPATPKKEPVAVAPMPKEPEPKPLPKPVNADEWDKLPLPSVVRDAVGRLESETALVVRSRPKDGAPVWDRQAVQKKDDLDDANAVFSTEPLMALPGYKANVLVGPLNRPAVEVLLWGNIPEQLAYRVLESKVVFHKPADGFDAELTLLAGRFYMKSVKQDADRKPAPAKVRVRLANTKEIWDVTLPDANADAMVELVSWYQPGKAGVDPRREARAVAVRGPVGFQTTGNREKKFDKIDGGAEVRWDSASGTLSDPAPSTNIQELVRVPTLDAGNQKALAAVLADMAKPGIISVVLSQRMDPEPGTPNRDLVARAAIYSWAALADSTAAGCDSLKELVKILNSGLPWLSRQAAITALVQWVGRERGNTELLRKVLNDPTDGVQPLRTADAVLEMLRGYISPTEPESAKLDELLSRLAGVKQDASEVKRPAAIALREVALWNLASADTGQWIPPPFQVNVGAVDKFDSKEYEGFLNDWRKRVEAIKARTKRP